MRNEENSATAEPLGWTKEAIREFVSIAVHDLREPLRAIRASSELLAGTYEDPSNDSAARCLRYIREGVDRIESLVYDIGEFCYAEVRALDRQETGMDVVLMEAQRQLSDELKGSEAILTQDPLPVVTGDFLALAAVFHSLIQNACKFRGTAPPRIHVGAKRQESEWIFSVRDNSMGFSPVYGELIFHPFERLNGKQYPGSGLGLPLAKRILERHGGRIWAESKPGEGSNFCFSLPASE